MTVVAPVSHPLKMLLSVAASAGLVTATLNLAGPARAADDNPVPQPPTAAITQPTPKVKGDAEVKIKKVKVRKGELRIKGKVTGVDDKRSNVYLEHKNSKKRAKKSGKKYRTVTRSSANKRGRFELHSRYRKGKFRVRAILPNDPASLKPSSAKSFKPNKPTPPVPVTPPKPAPKPKQKQGVNWVVAMGDSYMSGEGGAYAGFNPQTNAKGNLTDRWWAQIYGSNLRETFPGDYEQPIPQAGLTQQQLAKYSTPLYGWLCHRSGSASMYWGDTSTAALNLACSGATAKTDIDAGKPGVDFANGTSSSASGSVDIKGQAGQLQDFATKVRAKGDEIDQILLSIGGNDIQFDTIVTECVTKYIETNLTSCAGDPKSMLNQQYAKGQGLTEITNAVINSGDNIVTAMRAAGYPDNSYTIQLASYPIGVPAAAAVERQFSNWPKRQDYCGMGLNNADLDLITGGFKDLMRQRSIEGATTLAKRYPEVGVKVLDASDALKSHELCSNAIAYPDIGTDGVNTLQPQWHGPMGGSTATWMSPVWACAQVGLLCGLSTLYELMPKLMTAMDCEPVKTSGPKSKCANSLAKANVQSLPFHPSYFGQRALANCQQVLSQSPDRRIMRCTTPSSPGNLNPVGMPNMVTKDAGALN